MSNFFKYSIAAVFAAALTACGGSEGTSEPTPAPAPVEEPASEPETPEAEPAEAEAPGEAPQAETTPAPTPASDGSPEFADLPAPYNTADYARGKRVFRTCSSCHLLDPEAGNLVGPNLHGMFNRKAGALDGYTFSRALSEADFQWTAAELDNWLSNPNSYLPGNNMTFTGVRRLQDREAVIAYLLVETNK